MSLVDLSGEAIVLIRDCAARHTAPVVYSSFGKDSLVLLDLVRQAGLHLPVIFHREIQADTPQKYEFADRVIAEGRYTVHDWAPVAVAVAQRGAEIELVNLHQGHGGSLDYLPIGIRSPIPGEPFACALQDFYGKPRAETFDFPWDLGFVGHKSSDTDLILGSVPLATAYYVGSSGWSLAFPLKDWTDEDVWKYTQQRALPINHMRYAAAEGWREREDVTWNPDYFRACVACLDASTPRMVHCPRFGHPVRNVSALVDRVDPGWRPAYVGGGDGGR